MGILEIDYPNLVVKKELVKDRLVYTIDNFYKYPHIIVAKLLCHERKKKKKLADHNYYPGVRFDLDKLASRKEVDDHLNQFRDLLCSHGFDRSRFSASIRYQDIPKVANLRYQDIPEVMISKFSEEIGLSKPLVRVKESDSLEKRMKEHFRLREALRGNTIDTRTIPDICKTDNVSHELRGSMANPHCDSSPRLNTCNKLAAVCYLSKAIHGGTGLYYNKKLQTHCASYGYEIKRERNMVDKLIGATQDEKAKVLYLDREHYRLARSCNAPGKMMSESDEFYDLIHKFSMEFNRLIVYEGDLYHSMYVQDIDFWRKHDRITTNYFIPIYWQDEQGQSVDPNKVMGLGLGLDAIENSKHISKHIEYFHCDLINSL